VGFDFWDKQGFFSSPPCPYWLWVPSSLLSSGCLSLFPPGGKVARHKADNSPPSGAKVKNVWNYTFTPLYVFMAWYVVKHRNYFILLYFKPVHALISEQGLSFILVLHF
jgi:hypothetical protein